MSHFKCTDADALATGPCPTPRRQFAANANALLFVAEWEAAGLQTFLDRHGGLLTYQQLHELWPRLKDQPHARREVCRQLESGAITLLQPRDLALGSSRSRIRWLPNPAFGYSVLCDAPAPTRFKTPGPKTSRRFRRAGQRLLRRLSSG